MGGKPISRELTLLDGAAIVLGASVAALHVRLAVPDPHAPAGWVFAAGIFAWIAVTATGPFLYVSRRLVPRADVVYPQVGDRLWVLWGIPWVASAVVESVLRSRATADRLDPVYVGCLGLGLFLATAIAVPVLAARLLWGDPASPQAAGFAWTQWVGLALTTIWPIQCGVGLVLMG